MTDCNVMLGKLQPDHFPALFGPGGDQPLDQAIVRKKFTALAEEIAAAIGGPVSSPEAIAEGFLRIAVENMANAIKKISVQRGYDVTRYTFNCFGGAGGQHACLVADALGMTRVMLHPFAGVLSAFGMGLAEIRALREAQVERPVAETDAAETVLTRLADDAAAEVEAQGVARERIAVERRAHLRYAGSHQALAVTFGSEAEMRERFDQAHLARFGFTAPSRELTIEMVSVEAVGGAGELPEAGGSGAGDTMTNAVATVRMHVEGEEREVALHRRESLVPGQPIDGPSIISEATGTVVIEPGWRAWIDFHRNLILERIVERGRDAAIGTDVDPVMLEVFNNLFMSIAEQMGATLANTAYSVNIKERLDFSCALFDADGDLVANAPHVPVHLGSMSESVRTIMRHERRRHAPR